MLPARPPWMQCPASKKKCAAREQAKRRAAAHAAHVASPVVVVDSVEETSGASVDAFVEAIAPKAIAAQLAASGVCPCVITARVLLALGAPHAAAMHAKQEGRNGWTVADVQEHIADERTKLFPVVMAVADRFTAQGDHERGRLVRATIRQLEADHAMWTADYLDRGQLPPDSMLRPHGLIEDALVTVLEKDIRQQAGLPEAA